jgi:hypothetical protein
MTTATITSEKRNSIATKIKALQNKTVEKGCTEAEAMAAADMIGKLMREYDLSMSQVEFQAEKFETLNIETGSKVAGPLHRVVSAIATFTDTKVWFSRTGVISYKFFGSTQDTQIAEYLYHLLLNAVTTEVAKFKKSAEYKNSTINGKTLTTSFIAGMANRLSARLNEMKRENSKPTGTGLMVIDKMQVVKSEFSKLNMRLGNSKTKTTVGSSSAFNAGRSAADKVTITTGIRAGGSNQLRLK